MYTIRRLAPAYGSMLSPRPSRWGWSKTSGRWFATQPSELKTFLPLVDRFAASHDHNVLQSAVGSAFDAGPLSLPTVSDTEAQEDVQGAPASAHLVAHLEVLGFERRGRRGTRSQVRRPCGCAACSRRCSAKIEVVIEEARRQARPGVSRKPTVGQRQSSRNLSWVLPLASATLEAYDRKWLLTYEDAA